MDVLHSGFDGLRFTVQTNIPPDLRKKLAEAKAEAVRTNAEVTIKRGGVALAVRRSGGMAFSAHSGEDGAEWYFLDPENRPKNNPGVTVDFRAMLLATGGLDVAQDHFETYMAALGIRYVETQLRVSRVDFAIDILAPSFEPEREALIVPLGTGIADWAEAEESASNSVGARITGLRAGAIANRQLAIYDKRAEVILRHKAGWPVIWNHTRAKQGEPPLDLANPDTSRVWRFELRLGSKQLRGAWEMRSWTDLYAKIGDALADFCQRIRYSIPQADPNRSRWPTHELWRTVEDVVAGDLAAMRSGAEPMTVKEANREEHKRMLDAMILGNLVSRASAEGVPVSKTHAFIKAHTAILIQQSREHPIPIDERRMKADARYRWR